MGVKCVERFYVTANMAGARSDAKDMRTFEVSVEVDMEAIAKDLGVRACRSKGGKAVECGGCVVVRRGIAIN